MEINTKINDVSLARIDSFVSHHPNGNFFQSSKAVIFFQQVENHEPILIEVQENGDTVGSLLAIIVKESGGAKGYLSRRCIIWGGPLVRDEDPEIYMQILCRLNEIANQKSILGCDSNKKFLRVCLLGLLPSPRG